MDELDANGHIYWSKNGNPRRKVFLDEDKGIAVQDIWMDLQDSLNQNIKITGYPTEKNPHLLERIIRASSREGDYILDCFAGSGTTLEVAESLNRNWIGIDNSSTAIESIFKRFFKGLDNMGDYVSQLQKDKIKPLKMDTLFSLSPFKNKIYQRTYDFISDSRYEKDMTDILNKYIVTS